MKLKIPKTPIVKTPPKTPVVKKAPKTPVVKKPPKTPVVKKAPKTPVVKKAPKTPVVKKPPKTPVVKTPPKTPVVKKPPKTPVVKKPPKTPVVKKAPKTPVVKKAPKTPVVKKPPKTPVAKKPPKTPVAKKIGGLNSTIEQQKTYMEFYKNLKAPLQEEKTTILTKLEKRKDTFDKIGIYNDLLKLINMYNDSDNIEIQLEVVANIKKLTHALQNINYRSVDSSKIDTKFRDEELETMFKKLDINEYNDELYSYKKMYYDSESSIEPYIVNKIKKYMKKILSELKSKDPFNNPSENSDLISLFTKKRGGKKRNKKIKTGVSKIAGKKKLYGGVGCFEMKCKLFKFNIKKIRKKLRKKLREIYKGIFQDNVTDHEDPNDPLNTLYADLKSELEKSKEIDTTKIDDDEESYINEIQRIIEEKATASAEEAATDAVEALSSESSASSISSQISVIRNEVFDNEIKYFDYILNDEDRLNTVIRSLIIRDMLKTDQPSDKFSKIDELKKQIEEKDKNLIEIINKLTKDELDKVFDELDKEADKIEKKKEDLKKLLDNNIPYPRPLTYNRKYQPNPAIQMYGMQLPHQFNRLLLLETMKLFKEQGIYTIVDLQDCHNGTNLINTDIKEGIGCNPFDETCEREMWEEGIYKPLHAENNYYKDKAHYYSVPYKDMRAGTIETWEKISEIQKITEEGNNMVIHCLAGAGRTGSVMLYLLMRDKHDLFTKDGTNFDTEYFKLQLRLPYLGFGSIKEFINNVKKAFFDKSVNKNEVNAMLAEVFNTKTQERASLLRLRLNRMLYFLAKEYQVNVFYTYREQKELTEEELQKYTPEEILKYEFENHYENIMG